MTPATATLSQRVRRFLDEDASTFALTASIGLGAYVAREFRAAASISTTRRLALAARKSVPMLPAIFVSSAVGIIGMKLTLGAVQDARRDYSRTSLLIAVPVFAALVHAPAGPRLMAKSAIGYGSFILAADYAVSYYHEHYNRELLPLEHLQYDDEDEFVSHAHLRDSDAFVHHGVYPEHAPYRRHQSPYLAAHLAEE